MKQATQSTRAMYLSKGSAGYSSGGCGLLLIALAVAGVFVSPRSAPAICENGCDFNNTYLGESALVNATTGYANTAVGYLALYTNTTGYGNTGFGNDALVSNTTAIFNTAAGSSALAYNTTGSYNTSDGAGALYLNTNGLNNTAIGFEALHGNTTGNSNTASGYHALYGNTTGNSNIAVGESAGINLTTGSNNIDIGNEGVTGDSKTIRIGTSGTHTKTVIAGIFGTTVAGGVGVIVGTNGKLGTVVSSARFKEEIKPMDKASEAILALQPVTFRYKHELDPDGIPQFGLIAEEVEKINSDLVARDEQGKPYTVRYEAVNAMLLNEFLKEHRKIEEQEASIAQLKSTVMQQRRDFEATIVQQQKAMEAVVARLKEHDSKIQKVSTQLAATSLSLVDLR